MHTHVASEKKLILLLARGAWGRSRDSDIIIQRCCSTSTAVPSRRIVSTNQGLHLVAVAYHRRQDISVGMIHVVVYIHQQSTNGMQNATKLSHLLGYIFVFVTLMPMEKTIFYQPKEVGAKCKCDYYNIMQRVLSNPLRSPQSSLFLRSIYSYSMYPRNAASYWTEA